MNGEKRSRIAKNKAAAFQKYLDKWGFTDYRIYAYRDRQLVFYHKDVVGQDRGNGIGSVASLISRYNGGYVYPPEGGIETFKSLDGIKEYLLLRKLSGI